MAYGVSRTVNRSHQRNKPLTYPVNTCLAASIVRATGRLGPLALKTMPSRPSTLTTFSKSSHPLIRTATRPAEAPGGGH